MFQPVVEPDAPVSQYQPPPEVTATAEDLNRLAEAPVWPVEPSTLPEVPDLPSPSFEVTQGGEPVSTTVENKPETTMETPAESSQNQGDEFHFEL